MKKKSFYGRAQRSKFAKVAILFETRSFFAERVSFFRHTEYFFLRDESIDFRTRDALFWDQKVKFGISI